MDRGHFVRTFRETNLHIQKWEGPVYDWEGDILFSLQKCERSESGTGGAGDPKVAGLCPGESASVVVVEDGSAVVSVSPGFMGALSSPVLEISVNGTPITVISSGSYDLVGLKAGDTVTMYYESGSGTKVTVVFEFSASGDEEEDEPMVVAIMCVAVWTVTLTCGNAESPFGVPEFQGWKCKEMSLSFSPTKDIPTVFSNGWIPPVDLSEQEEYANDPDLPDPCGVLVYVAAGDNLSCMGDSGACDDLPPPDPPPGPDLSKLGLWCDPCGS